MNFQEAWNLIGGLSKPSKMPWYSYSLPAKNCNIGSTLVNNSKSTCYDCYALKNFYNMPNVKKALERRLTAISSPDWVTAMALVLTHLAQDKPRHFRWHDSGDLQSLEHFRKIIEVCRLTPHITHWLPTKEYQLIKNLPPDFKIPPNLVIRISHPILNVTNPLKSLKQYPHAYVSDDESKVTCPARKQGNKCRSCRACWDKTTNVVYELH